MSQVEEPAKKLTIHDRLRRVWDDIIDTILVQLERFSAARASISGSHRPNRWRLRRLHRWQQREQARAEKEGRALKRETYDELIDELMSKRS